MILIFLECFPLIINLPFLSFAQPYSSLITKSKFEETLNQVLKEKLKISVKEYHVSSRAK